VSLTIEGSDKSIVLTDDSDSNNTYNGENISISDKVLSGDV
jgi:hypothetical protein